MSGSSAERVPTFEECTYLLFFCLYFPSSNFNIYLVYNKLPLEQRQAIEEDHLQLTKPFPPGVKVPIPVEVRPTSFKFEFVNNDRSVPRKVGLVHEYP